MVGSLLLGARISDSGGDSGGCALGVSTVVPGDCLPAIGRIPTEIPLPGGPEAAVVAVAHDDTPQLLDDRHRPCESGDRLVMASGGDRLGEVNRHLAG